jgi:CubicO group peptidase (beta-lactamase class C family)
LLIVSAALVLVPWSMEARQVVTGGPPPEIRALIDAFTKAFNSGSASEWEAMAKERFSADLLAKRSAEERKQTFERLRADFGNVTLDQVRRRGPDAPLDLHVKGATGAVGVFSLELTESGPPRIANMSVTIGGRGGETGPGDPPAPPVHARMTPDELSRALDAYLSRLAAADVFSGVALVAKNDVPVFQKAYGLANRANRIPNTVQTRFNIGSINKTFTQLAIEQLMAQGKVAPGDTLGTFVPDYPQAASRAATVAQLLSHTAGLSDFFGPEFAQAAKDRFRSNADYFRLVGSLPPLFAPGARNQYCNGCYIALGEIVARVAGMPYEQYVAEHIFKRADMMSTGYPHTDAIEPGIALGYTRRGGDGALRSNVFMHGAAGSAAGGGYSTAGDLLAYVNARRDGRLPKDSGMMGIAGGAPGTSAVVESNGVWTVIVLSNLDPPTGERLGVAIMEALGR